MDRALVAAPGVAAVVGVPDRLAAHLSRCAQLRRVVDVAFDVSERRRSIDVGDITTFQIKIKNYGSKEATRLLISAKLSDNIDAVETDNGSDQREQAQYNPAERELKFPQIDRLGPGKDLVLGIKVKANKPGMASCRVYLMHDDLETGVKLDAVAVTRVTSMRR